MAWLKEIDIWQAFTDIDIKKKGPAVFVTLEEKAHKTIFEKSYKINCKDGVKNVINCLNKLCLKDKTKTPFETYEILERYTTPIEMSISDFINEFEGLLIETKQYGSNMSLVILAYQLLKTANLSEYYEWLTRAAIPELNYNFVKTQLKNIFGDNPGKGSQKNPSFIRN